MSEKVAIVEYRRPSHSGTSLTVAGLTTVETERYPGGQVGREGDWLVVSTIFGNIAFYPRESVVRAWNEPASEA